MQVPSENYTLTTECDLECSEECLVLRTHYPLEVVDACNSLRCNCYYAAVDEHTCNHDCKAACLFTPGGRHEINQCLHDLCDCHDAHVDIAIHDMTPVSNHSNSTNHTAHADDHVADHHEIELHDHHEAHAHTNTTNTTSNHTTNSTFNTSAVISLMGYVGYESYFTNGNTEVVPQTDLPLVAISITFAVFMGLVLSLYFFLLKKEVQNDKKTSMLGYEDKNIYNEKLNFLENQEVCVSTL